MKKLVALLCLLPGLAWGQAAVQQAGPITNNTPVMWARDHQIRQAAGANGDVAGKMITGGFSAVGDICTYSATTNITPNHNLCISASGQVCVDGTCYTIPASVAIVGADAVVSNNTALKAVIGTTGKRLTRLGFAAIGDGGLAMYNWAGTNCAAADDGAQVQPAGTGCWIADFSLAPPAVTVWGVSTSSVASTTEMQKAVDYVCRVGSGELHMPAGHYNISDINIACPLQVSGEGVGVTIVDYSNSVSGHAFKWEPALWPAVKLADLMKGGAIRDVGFVRTNGSNTALIIHGSQDFVAERLRFLDAWNVVATKGVQNIKFSNIDTKGTYNINYDFVGDLTGIRDDGTPCAVADPVCSTRSDWIQLGQLFNIDDRQTNTCINITGFVATINSTGPIACEGPNIGLKATCPNGLDPAGSQCPHFIFLDNFQTELFKTYGYYIEDTFDVKMAKPYSYGDGSGSTVNALYMAALNYGHITACSGSQCTPPGKYTFDHGLFFAVSNDCVLGKAAASHTLMDITLDGNAINGCNLSNGGFGAVSMAPSGAGVQYGRINGNTLCSSGGFSSLAAQAYGIKYGATATDFISTGNLAFQCDVPIINTSAANYDFGTNPPPVVGTVTEVDGNIGSTGTIVFSIGNAFGGSIVITPSGSGISSAGNFTVTLPANVTMWPGMACVFQPATNWGNGATIFPVTANTTSVTATWRNLVNGALTNLSSATPYNINYRCSGF